MSSEVIIEKLKIINFKKFKETHDFYFNDGINIIIGDNETGKSTLLLAIDLVTCGSKNRIFSYGLENLFNTDCINDFMNGDKEFCNLPKLVIELYFKGDICPDLEGTNNEENTIKCGIKMEILPDNEYADQIKYNLNQKDGVFPFEYYKCTFKKFSGQIFDSTHKRINSLFVNSSTISSDNSIKQYVSNMYNSNVDENTKNKLNSDFRSLKKTFENNNLLNLLNGINEGLTFKLSKENKHSLENNLSLSFKDVDIVNKGDGYKCMLKVQTFIKNNSDNANFLLIEEPENHLSTTNMKQLINKIADKYTDNENNKQIFITTHNSYICSRLGLKSLISLNENSEEAFSLKKITEETSKYFMKCPSDSILQFILSNKVILVEGAAEYILMEKFYEICTQTTPNNDKITIISINGLSFSRYLEVAKNINMKVVVITDNDHNFQENIEQKYSKYNELPNIKIFSDKDNERYTFEVCVAKDNFDLLKTFISTKTIENESSLIKYMLNNKAESAYKILEHLENDKRNTFHVPEYIEEAIKWLKN